MSPRVTLVVTETTGDDAGAVERTLDSLLRQDDRDWEAVVTAPTSLTPGGGHRTSRRGHLPDRHDSRIRTVPVSGQSDLHHLLQAGLEAARGSFVGILAAGDQVEPGTLAAAVPFFAAHDVIYTDEQWAAEGAEGIATKPDWVPQNLESYPYLGRLTLVRTELARRVGGFREGFAGAEEWDLALRATETTDRVGHLPLIGVTRAAPPPHDSSCTLAGAHAVQLRLARTGRVGDVVPAEVPRGVRAWLALPTPPPLVSIIIPTAGGRRVVRGRDTLLVEQCLRSLRDTTTYDAWEVVLVVGEGIADDVLDEVRALVPEERLVVTRVAGRFNFSTSVNEAARVARGSLLLLLNDDTEVVEPRWLERMVTVAQDPGVGAVGAKLLFENGTIQHLGITFDDTHGPIHALGSEVDGVGRWGAKVLDSGWAAVTGACLLVPADLFAEVGGFCTDLPLNYNDVDFCLKIRATGRSVVCTPFATLFHYESSSRGHALEPWEYTTLHERWRLRILADPYVQYRSNF
ncbi:MAG TPA: glycosyltransferase [Propionicimonas sp.]